MLLLLLLHFAGHTSCCRLLGSGDVGGGQRASCKAPPWAGGAQEGVCQVSLEAEAGGSEVTVESLVPPECQAAL